MAPTASNTTLLDSSRCSMACSDSQYTENCGGSSTLLLFQNAALYPAPVVVSSSTVASSTSASSTSVVVSTAAATSSSATAIASNVASSSASVVSSSTAAAAASTGVQSTLSPGFKDVGCVAEASGARALTGASYSSSKMSRQSCTAFCASKGMPLAGIEYGLEW